MNILNLSSRSGSHALIKLRGLLGVQLSPTLILTDSTGTVHGSWIGQLSAQQETEVWTMLKN